MTTTNRQQQLLLQLHEVYDRVATAMDLERFSQSLVDAMKEVFGYPLVGISFIENDVLVPYYVTGFAWQIPHIPLCKGIMGRVARTAQPCLVPDVTLDPDFIATSPGIRSEIAVPLFAQDQVIGVLNIESQGDMRLSEDDLQLMLIIGRYASLRLGQIHLFDSLQESEKRYRNLIDNLPGIVYRCANDADWTEELINDNSEKITGYPGSDFYHNAARSFDTIAHPEDRQLMHQTVEQALAQRKPFDLEYRIIHADGSIRWVFDQGQGIFDEKDNLAYIEGVILDVTERKQAAEALRASEERNRALLHAIPDLMFLKSVDGYFLDYHASRPADLLVPPEAFLGKHASEVMPPGVAEQLVPLYQRAAQSGALQIAEYALGVPGEEHFFEARVVPCGTDKVLSIIRDITERKRAELLLVKRNEEVEAINRMKDEFLASMSHELRTPLNAILTISESLQEGVYGTISEPQRNVLTTMEKSGRHLLALINDVLDVAKIESGKFALDFAPVVVQEVCEHSINLIKEQVRKKRLKFSQIFDHTVETVWGDGRRLVQILVNLLTNAIKFTPEGGSIGLEVSGDAEQKTMQFTVWDSGIGIAPEDQERVFQPFIQLDSKLARHYEGTGLGLALVQRLTEMHGGVVTLKSEPGRGTTFTIILPWDENAQQALTPNRDPSVKAPVALSIASKPKEPVRPKEHTPLILLVEDNLQNALVLEDFLTMRQYRVMTAENGLQAVEQAIRHRPDLILMDIQMPEMDGLSATRHIRADANLGKTPIIALTAMAMPGDRERCSEAGMNEYLSKPVNLRQLVQVIEGQLQRQRMH